MIVVWYPYDHWGNPAPGHIDGQDLATLMDATRHFDGGPELDAVRLRIERALHPEGIADEETGRSG